MCSTWFRFVIENSLSFDKIRTYIPVKLINTSFVCTTQNVNEKGVSTTDIVGRMLMMTKEHHMNSMNDDVGKTFNEDDSDGSNKNDYVILGSQSKFLTTSRMLRLFSAGHTAPTKDMKVIYMDGAWDMVRRTCYKHVVFKAIFLIFIGKIVCFCVCTMPII